MPIFTLKCCWLVAIAVFSSEVVADIYIYSRPNGSILVTNKVHHHGYRLLKTYPLAQSSRALIPTNYTHVRPVYSRYDTIIRNTALRYRIEPALVKAVVHAESGFNPDAVSSAGAMGLMQLMPATASDYNLTSNHFDPNNNILVGVQHLRMLLNKYDNNKKLALAAYNAGAYKVKKYSGIPPYPETQNYIRKVMRLYGVYSSLE